MNAQLGPFGRRLAVLASWLLAIALGSALTWVAVDRAGRAVLDPGPASRAVATGPAADQLPDAGTPAPPDPTPVPPASATTAAPEPAPPVATGGNGGGAGGGRGGTSTGSSGGSGGSGGVAAGGSGGSGGSGTSGGGSGSPSGGGTPAPPPAPAAQPQSGTRSTEGGTVAVSCSGDAVSLQYATPAAGWSAEVRDTGPDEVRVRFKRGDGSGESELDVRARCSGGSPTFAAGTD